MLSASTAILSDTSSNVKKWGLVQATCDAQEQLWQAGPQAMDAASSLPSMDASMSSQAASPAAYQDLTIR